VADDESCGDASELTAGYERLRAAVLSDSAGGWRLGHAVLSARGMVGWMSTFGPLAPTTSGGAATAPLSSAESCEPLSAQPVLLPGAEQVVAVLAQMVLPLAA
jgi:hypothetical protein